MSAPGITGLQRNGAALLITELRTGEEKQLNLRLP